MLKQMYSVITYYNIITIYKEDFMTNIKKLLAFTGNPDKAKKYLKSHQIYSSNR